MKKLLLISLIALSSCNKKDDPAPSPTTTGSTPVIDHYLAKVSVKSVKHDVNVSEPSPRDSSYFTLRVNSKEQHQSSRYTNSPSNIVLEDSVKTGDTLTMIVKLRAYKETFRDSPTVAYFRMNKAFLLKGSTETVLAEGVNDTIPITYSGSIGEASRSWQYIIP